MNNNAKKKKADRQNLYVTIIVILMMVAVVVAIAVSLAKNTGEINEDADTTEEFEENVAPQTEAEDGKSPALDTEDVFFNDEEDTDADEAVDTEPEEEPSADTAQKEDDSEASSVLPSFVAPVQGELLRGCSLEVPVFSQTMEDYRTHSGVDLYCEAGSDIAAAADGTVKEIWDDPMMGMCISIEHSGGAVSVYKNLYDEIPEGIEAGVQVRGGQVIATAGDSALLEVAEEGHLHFELSINGETVDPSEYIEFSSTPVFAE